MEADTVIAAAAVATAVAALGVSVTEAQAARTHNRRSVRPILQVRKGFVAGSRAGIRVTNVGLGPAAVTGTEMWLDDVQIGGTDRAGVDRLRDRMQGPRPRAASIGAGMFLAADYDEYLLSVDAYDPVAHAEFAELVRHRMRVRITYDSLYGGESFVVDRGPDT